MPFATPKTKIDPKSIKTTVVKKDIPVVKSAKKLSDHSSIAAKMAESSFSRTNRLIKPAGKSATSHEDALKNVAILSKSIINQNYQIKSPEVNDNSESETDSDSAESPGASSPSRTFQINEGPSHMDNFLNMFDAIGGAMLDDRHIKNKSSLSIKNELPKIDPVDLPSKFEFDPYNDINTETEDCETIIPSVKSDSHFNIALYHKSVEEHLRRLSSNNESSVSKFIKSGLNFIKPTSPRQEKNNSVKPPLDPNKIKIEPNPNHSIGKLIATGLGVKHKPQPFIKPLPVYDDELGGVWSKLPWSKVESWLPAFYCCGGKVKVLGYIRLPSPITTRQSSFPPNYNNSPSTNESNNSNLSDKSNISPPNTSTYNISPPTSYPPAFTQQKSIDYPNSSISLVPIVAPVSFTDANNLIDILPTSECETIVYPSLQFKNSRLRNFKPTEFEPYGSIDHYGNYLNHALHIVQPKHNVSEVALRNAKIFAAKIVDQFSQVHFYKVKNGI